MTHPLANFVGYERIVADMLAAYPEDEAMSRAVGGNYAHFGTLEHAALLQAGLFPTAAVLDIGCGSGRLAVQLATYPGLRYHGFDIVPALLDYARRRAGRADFQFGHPDGFRLPLGDETVDFVTSFSVFTHLLHEESFAYLSEAMRVLRPGGKILLSFLDPCLDAHWPVFAEDVKAVLARTPRGHPNTFIHPDQLRHWARRLGAEVAFVMPGTEPFVQVGRGLAAEATPAGRHPFGQSLALLAKPRTGGLPAGQITGFGDHSPSPDQLWGWARIPGADEVRLDVEVLQNGRFIGHGRAEVMRGDIGPHGFRLTLAEPLDEEAFFNGGLVLRARLGNGEPVPLGLYKGLSDTMCHRRALRLLRELPEAERAAVLREWQAG